MTKAKTKPVTSDPNALPVSRLPEQSPAQALARTALRPAINGAVVVKAYQGNLLGKDVDMSELVKGFSDSCKRVNNGDRSTLEAMLVSQAMALQTVFTSLVCRAQVQTQQRHLEAFMGLAFKAQAQSRATISALVDLKHPRQATFVKQANIAHGPQQVNNGTTVGANPELSAKSNPHGKEINHAPNKLLEVDHGQSSGRMDTREAQAAERSNQAVETVGKVHRSKKPRG